MHAQAELGLHLQQGVVTHIRIRIDSTVREASGSLTTWPRNPRGPERAVEEYKSGVPVAMNVIFSIVPSLRCVLVDFTAHGMKGRMNVDDGEGKSLNDAECRVIMRKEGLQDQY